MMPKDKDLNPMWTRRRLLAACVAAPVLAGVGGAFRPAWAQDEAFRILDLDWADTARQRPVPVRLYLPAQASRANPVPLVVFSHGIGGSRRGYSYLGSHFASEGFASLHLQHVGSDRSLWSAGSPLALVGRLQDAAQEAEAIARVHDLRFALSQALGGEFGTLLDGQRVVAAGHSYGANTALLASGARVVREGRTLDLREPRLRAAIVISAPPFYGEPAPRRILGGVQVKLAHVRPCGV